MLDFFIISKRCPKQGVVEIYPRFIAKTSKDLMIRGGDFYAVWVEERGLWSTDEEDVVRMIDAELDSYVKEHESQFEGTVKVLHMWDCETGMIDRWHKYCQKQQWENFVTLDEKLIFANDPARKEDYASKRLSYPLEAGECPSFEKLIGTLYAPEERHKLEWAIGSIVCGDSRYLQKFMVLYGASGAGKSTILNIIGQLFEGYEAVFSAKALGSSNNAFALEAFRSNPLVAIQHDGDLSKIEDNTMLNSLVSHETMLVNEKFKAQYSSRFKCFLFMGTNKPVRITDGKSGLIRRLIDVTPSGNKLPLKEYNELVGRIPFELGAIAKHCMDVYQQNPNAYDDYIPVNMLGASNDFYNFVIDAYHVFKKEDGTTLKTAWEMYKTYCDEARVPYPYSQRNFKEELKNYFYDFKERMISEDGSRIRSVYSGFRTDQFEPKKTQTVVYQFEASQTWLKFEEQPSLFDKECLDCTAQYGSDTGKPMLAWANVTTRLADLETNRLHYVLVPLNHIVIDFDLKDENGCKSFQKNLEAASKWPPTYAELSKSGNGIHLHYLYSGDATKLHYLYAEDIEIKVFTGKSSLRRMLTKCNDIPIATLSSGLPTKGEKKVLNQSMFKSEQGLRSMIRRNLNKEFLPGTKPSMDFIRKILDDAYNSELRYDISDMKNEIIAFAANSTNQAEYCLKLIPKLHFKSELAGEAVDDAEAPIVIFDVEVFPNLFLVNWKYAGTDMPVVRMINPKPEEIERLTRMRLVGFNNRKYDNHMLYGCMIGYTNQELFELSSKIINEKKGFFGEAYNLSYTDIYDFSSKRQGLKKFEIELGFHHQELGLPWDQPVPEEMWEKVAEYCDNDVLATEALFFSKDRQADFTARKILADVAGMTVNDTTNSLTTRIIFGSERKPQSVFNYRFMGVPENDLPWEDYTRFDEHGWPIFPGYKYEFGVSTYRGEEVGEGGYVFSVPGMYGNVALLDIASMHPSSIVAEKLFGIYTERFEDILNARIAIKHKDFERARKMLGGALAKYLDDESAAADLAQALKIAINSVYGLTSASFENPFRDIRNVDNIVAKRGALFMINLKHEVQNKGYTVAHIKTDSIKIPDADLSIIQFVTDYGKQYGYNFEHEATYDRMCLVNDAVYIAKYATVEHCCELYGESYVNGGKDICKENKKHPNTWTATGTQFQIPYVFKTLFSHEDIQFEDMCETKSVSSALYLDLNDGLGDDHVYQFVGKVGLFCPMLPGSGGGELLREGKDREGNRKFSAATGSKGYLWMESEMVRNCGKESQIDRSYYDNLVTNAVRDISEYGDFEWFVSDDPYIPVYPYMTADDSDMDIFNKR